MQVRNHTVFENLRAHKLLHALQRVPRRIIKATNKRMLGDSRSSEEPRNNLVETTQDRCLEVEEVRV